MKNKYFQLIKKTFQAGFENLDYTFIKEMEIGEILIFLESDFIISTLKHYSQSSSADTVLKSLYYLQKNYGESVEISINEDLRKSIYEIFLSKISIDNGFCEEKKDIISWMVKKFQLNVNGEYNYSSPLSRAVSEGSLDLLNFLVELGADVNFSCSKSGSSKLLEQTYSRHPTENIALYERLVELGARQSITQLAKTSFYTRHPSYDNTVFFHKMVSAYEKQTHTPIDLPLLEQEYDVIFQKVFRPKGK